MSNEEWRTIPSSPSYEVSSRGRVRRAKPARNTSVGRVLKQCLRNGYPAVNLSENNRTRMTSVHRAVAEAFIGPCGEDIEVNHINGIRTDNGVENLEYVTRQGNALHAHRTGLQVCKGERNGQAKMTADQVREIRRLARRGVPIAEIARTLDRNPETVRDAAKGRTWAHVA